MMLWRVGENSSQAVHRAMNKRGDGDDDSE
jgi:hypothetical protein